MRGRSFSIAWLYCLALLLTACPKQEQEVPATPEIQIDLPDYRAVPKEMHVISDRRPIFRSVMKVIDGCPAVAFASENTTPMGDPVTWHHTEANMYFSQALAPIPTQTSDWTIHQLSPGHAAPTAFGLVELAGKPVLFYMEAGTGTVMAVAKVPHPQSDADWEHFTFPPQTYPCHIAVIDGRLAIALLHTPETIPADVRNECLYRDFKLLRQLDADKLDPATWSSHVFSLEKPMDTQSMRLADDAGVPVFSYATQDLEGTDTMFFWRATTPDPVKPEDWVRYVVKDNSVFNAYECRLTVYNSQPVLVYESCRPTHQLMLSIGQPDEENTGLTFSTFALEDCEYFWDTAFAIGDGKLYIGWTFLNQGYVVETGSPTPSSRDDFFGYTIAEASEKLGVDDLQLGVSDGRLVGTYTNAGRISFVAFE